MNKFRVCDVLPEFKRSIKQKHNLFSALLRGILVQQIYYGQTLNLCCGALLPSKLKMKPAKLSAAGAASDPNRRRRARRNEM